MGVWVPYETLKNPKFQKIFLQKIFHLGTKKFQKERHICPRNSKFQKQGIFQDKLTENQQS